MAGATATAVTWPRDAGLGPNTVKKGLRGAAGGVYVGPLISKTAIEGPSSPTHALTVLAGGVEDTTGHRESDTYGADANTGGFTGGPATSVTRPTGRTAFIASGIQGGSLTTGAGDVIDVTGRAEDTGVDRFGRSLTGDAYPNGSGRYTYTNFDGRSSLDGDGGRALGAAGRGTTVDGETVTVNIGRPATDGTNEGSGTVAIVGAAGAIQAAIHADDLPASATTNGTNGHAGCLIAVYKRGTDTDEDGAHVGTVTFGTASTDGSDNTNILTSLTAGTYAVYVRWLYFIQGGLVRRVGPASPRATVVVS